MGTQAALSVIMLPEAILVTYEAASGLHPPSRQSYPTDSATFSYVHEVLWQSVSEDIYDEEEHGRAEPAISSQLYPHMIEARRLEGVPNLSLDVNGESPHMRKDRSRRTGSESSDDTIGSILELGIGIPEDDSDIVSFNTIVERGVSNISPSSSVDMDIAEQQAESSDSDE